MGNSTPTLHSLMQACGSHDGPQPIPNSVPIPNSAPVEERSGPRTLGSTTKCHPNGLPLEADEICEGQGVRERSIFVFVSFQKMTIQIIQPTVKF